MARPKKYADDAARQKAHRERQKQRMVLVGGVVFPPPLAPKKPSKRSSTRPARFAAAVEQLADLCSEYEAAMETVPEQLQGGAYYAALEAAVQGLHDALDQLADVQLPKGFGRD